MREITVRGLPEALEIGARGLAGILQNVRVILTTLAGDLPLDRAFAGPGEYIDRPVNAVRRRELAAWVEAIERHEPRVKVTQIRFETRREDALDGRVYPVAVLRLRDAVAAALEEEL